MSNLRIIYPDISVRAAGVSTSATFNEREPLANLDDGRRDNMSSSSSSDVLISHDLGSATTAAADHFLIARADKITLTGTVRVQGSSVSRFAPGSISGLKVWLDSNRSVTVDGSNGISTWTDLSGAGNNFTQGTAANRPVLSSYATGTNGNRKTTFDASNDVVSSSYAVNPTGGFWCGVLVTPAAIGAAMVILDAYSAAGGARFILRVNSTGTVEALVFNGTTNQIGRRSTTTLSASTTYAITVTYDGTTAASGIKIYLDGTQIDTTDVNAGAYTVPTAGATLQIGGPFTAQYFNGAVNEVLFYEGTATTTNRQTVESYLATKWKTTALVNETALGSASYYGVRSKDYLSTFTQSSAFRHWWIEFYGTTAFKPSKIYFGSIFNPSVDADFSWALEPIGSASFVSGSGEVRTNRIGSPVYSFDLSWEGLTDSEVNTFAEKIWKRRHKSGFFLYAAAQGQILDNKTLVHVRCTSADWERIGKANYNVLRATFEELQ